MGDIAPNWKAHITAHIAATVLWLIAQDAPVLRAARLVATLSNQYTAGSTRLGGGAPGRVMYLTVTFTRLPQRSQVVRALTNASYTPRESLHHAN